MTVQHKGGRPKLEPTTTITIRMPVSMMQVVQRRSSAANMSPGIWLVERVIQNEVMRKHRTYKRNREEWRVNNP